MDGIFTEATIAKGCNLCRSHVCLLLLFASASIIMRFDIVYLTLSIAEVIKDNKLDSMAKLGVQRLNMVSLGCELRGRDGSKVGSSLSTIDSQVLYMYITC